MDKIIEILNELLSKIEDLEDISVHNNNLLGFLIERTRVPQPQIKINTDELQSIYITGEMIDYLQKNDISMDFVGDA